VSNSKAKQQGLWPNMRLRFPTYREGLSAEHAGDTYPF
jgi:hypothetical protein